MARYLVDAGFRVAVLTPGQADELEVHSLLNADVPVAGGRSRSRLAERAADNGANVVLLDSGFQHRRLARDLDVVTVLVDDCGGLRSLPAGPARERWAALGRADSVVLVRRRAPLEAGRRLERMIAEAFPGIHIAHVSIKADSLEPVSSGARTVPNADPQLAVAGVMWPELFFADVGSMGLAPDHELSLADHAEPPDRSLALMTGLAGSRGIVCTAKDAGKLSSLLPDSIPIWRLDESVTWGDGGSALLAGIEWLVRLDSHGGDHAA
jgi:tetraacyldisaccharide 4'-kinase